MSYSWKKVDFDTHLFGFKVAKIENIQQGYVNKLIADLEKGNIVYATYRLPADNFPLIHQLEDNGFRLVDGLLAFEKKLNHKIKMMLNGNIREASNKDLPQLTKLADGIFTATRFYNDPFIPKKKADELYVKWVENSLKGEKADLVIVWEDSSASSGQVGILGFITLKKDGHLPLIGVAKEAQGKGIGKKLLQAALVKLNEWNVEKAKIETQLTNIPAKRAYQAAGFKIVSSYLTFRWKIETAFP